MDVEEAWILVLEALQMEIRRELIRDAEADLMNAPTASLMAVRRSPAQNCHGPWT